MAEEKSQLTRRGLLTGAGVAAAAGLGVATAGSAGATALGDGEAGATVVEFRGRIAQSGAAGEQFTSYGFLTRAVGARQADLFAGSATSVSTALVTAYATGELTARVLDMSVHSLDIAGEMTLYHRSAPGADFTDPDSFRQGSVLARYALTLQDVLAVFAPARGIPTLTGDLRQTLVGSLGGRRFGRPGGRYRMFATGLGELVDPVTLNALLEIAGNWSVSAQ